MGSVALPAMSARIDANEARQLASEFFESHSGRVPSLQLCERGGSDANPLFYVFNDDVSGFVIISAEDATTPVVGYSFDSNYLPQAAPAAMKWVLDGIGAEINAASKLQKSISPAERRLKAVAKGALTPKLLSTANWSQEGPFNKMIPGQPLVGCVGTAMATIMKYHSFPAAGQGDKGGVSFDVTYDWDNMRTDNYRGSYSQTEADAVATLMWHAAKSVDTQFGMSGSSAYEVRVPGALSTYFGYDPGVSYKKRAEVASQQAWDEIVINEINNGRPVLYCGQDVSAGHAFVCDGYDAEGRLHFNWGWGGSANGYFSSTMLNPTVSRTHNYNNLNTIIYNIKPGNGNTAWSPIRLIRSVSVQIWPTSQTKGPLPCA